MNKYKNHILVCSSALALGAVGDLQAQTLVGTGSFYATPFTPVSEVTHGIAGIPAILAVNNGTSTSSPGIWDLSAQGAAKLLFY